MSLTARRVLPPPAPWLKDALWRKAKAVPSVDLRFADSKSLVDSVSGQNLITFTRASSATFVGSDGVLQTAVTNLLLRSEEFGTTWATGNASVSANVVAAPNGTLTADKLVEDSSASTFHRIQQTATLAAGAVAYSVYLKAAERNFALLKVFNSTNNNYIDAKFNLQAGTVDAALSGSASITNVGNGWFRCSVTSTTTVTANNIAYVYSASVAGGGSTYESYTGDGTSGIYIWGAQLEQSSTVGEYIPTTSAINSAPRFDHNPTTGESLGLLVEEQRTNSIRNNTMVGAVAGTPGTNPNLLSYATVQSNGLTLSIAGLGIENGINYIDYRFNGTTVASPSAIAISFDNAVAATGQAWTASTYWKIAAGSTTGVTNWQIGIIESTSASGFITGAFYNQNAPTGAALGTQRFTATRTLSGGATVGMVTMPFNITVTGNTAIDFTLRIGMPQLEQGAFVTSVIPTTTSQVTRAADVATITGTAFSSWYRQDEGTVYADLVTSSRGHASYPRMVAILGSDVNNGNEASIYTRNLGTSDDYKLYGTYWDATGSSADFFVESPVGSGRVAMAIKNNDGGYCVNGITPISDTSCAVPTPIQLRLFGQARYQPASSGYIKRLTYFPTRLPNTTLQRITQ